MKMTFIAGLILTLSQLTSSTVSIVNAAGYDLKAKLSISKACMMT